MAVPASEPSFPDRRFSLEPYAYAEARVLAQELGLAEPVAITLVRRGHRTVAAAKAFLEADEHHDPYEFAGMAEVVDRLRAAVGVGARITVHGDYDADGVCSTAILVATLRAMGAECDWYIPDRLADGYGLTAEGVERLRERGTELLITTDCGITCADEVALAREVGLEVIVTDHHQPAGDLPKCPVLHPSVCSYPCPDLCATGVAYKLASALRGADADSELDLVALATVADLVPLRGENRALVRRGLELARRAQRPGLRALIAAAGIEPERLDEGDLAFRLAPRINADGRLYRADAGVELMLTADEDRAKEIAEELNRANLERRDTEREVLRGAEAAYAKLPADVAAAPALVIAGEAWHPGVVGICASRLVESTGRPVVLISVDSNGRGKGSGRSVPGFDLLGALEACAEHLDRFGGHSGAAGLELDADRIPAFREAFAAHASRVLGDGPPPRTEEIDAVVGADELGLEVAEQLARLAPFGKGNPPVRLIVPGARVRDVRPMGEGNRHARFSLESASGRARGVAFGVNGQLAGAAEAGPLDVSLSLEVNHWNGAVEPRVVLGEVYTGAPDAAPGVVDEPDPLVLGAEEWASRVEAELVAPLEAKAPAAPAGHTRRRVVDRRGRSGVATVAALASTGEPALVVCADAARRRALVERAAVPARFGGGSVVLAAGAAGDVAVRAALARLATGGDGGVALADWARLERDPEIAAGFEHVVLIDPPPTAEHERLVDRSGPSGFLHLAWGEAEVDFSLRAWDGQWPSRASLAGLYRDLATVPTENAGPMDGPPRSLLSVGDRYFRSPEVAGRHVRVLLELELVRLDEHADGTGSGAIPTLGVVSSESTDLTRSKAFVAYRARHEEGRRYLSRRRHLR